MRDKHLSQLPTNTPSTNPTTMSSSSSVSCSSALITDSLLSRLETSCNYKGMRQDFLTFLKPFQKHIPLAFDSSSKKNNQTKFDWKQRRSLAKQYVSFLQKALKLFLNELRRQGQETEELLDVYKLCLECLDFVLPCMDGKLSSFRVYWVKLVRGFEVHEKYQQALVEGFHVFDILQDDLEKNPADLELCKLVVEVLSSIVKCTFTGKMVENRFYVQTLHLVDRVTPWLRVDHSEELEKLYKVLVLNLCGCTRYMLKKEIFDAGLVHQLCMKTLTECLHLKMEDSFIKLALNIVDSLWERKPLLITEILRCVLGCIVADFKVGVESDEYYCMVHYYVKKYQFSSLATDFSRSLQKMANDYRQVFAPMSSILRIYAAGLVTYSNFQPSFRESKSLMTSETISLLDCGEALQDSAGILGSLANYFHITSTNCPNPYPGCSVTCKNRAGKVSFLLYLSALAFFCQQFAAFVINTYKLILAEKESSILSSNANTIHGAFCQFYDAFLIGLSYSYTATNEKELFDECQQTLVLVAKATFVISLRTDNKTQETTDWIFGMISKRWINAKEVEPFVGFLFNVGAVFYNSNKLKQASVAFGICCKSAWTNVMLLCNKNVEKSEGGHEDWSEEAISGLVGNACRRSTVLLDVLHRCGSADVHSSVVATLSNWSIAANLFPSLSGPMSFVRKWVQIICTGKKDVDLVDNIPILYSLMSKSSATMKRTVRIILEQELLAYEQREVKDDYFSRRMSLRIIHILLSEVYVTQDYSLEKSKILIKKARVIRTFGVDDLNICIECLSEAISTLVDMSNELPENSSESLHHLALAYCLHAMCIQECKPNSEVIFNDLHRALKLWLSVNWSVDVHYELVTENVSLLICVADLLSAKGYFQLQCDTLKLIIVLLKLKSMPLEECLTLLWTDRRLSHAFCTTPVHEDFITSLAQQFSVDSDSVTFWINCIKNSEALVNGLCQKFSLSDAFLLTQVDHCHRGSPFGLHINVTEIKKVALNLVSNVHLPSSLFLAAYLYHDLSERFISNGQLIEALSFAREAFYLRSALRQKKYNYKFSKEHKNSTDTGETTQRHLVSYGSVATIWPHVIGSWNLEGCNLSSWKVLEAYLESLLQVGAILEAIGNACQAEAYLQLGNDISCKEGLPIFRVAFASALGKIYCKKQLWDAAQSEVNNAKQILMDNGTTLSCKRCKLTLEATVDCQVADLIRKRFNVTTICSSVNSFSDAFDLYKSALEKMNHPEWEVSLSFFEKTKETDKWDDKELHSQVVEDVQSQLKMESKKARKSKNSSKYLLKVQNSEIGPSIRITRSRAQSSRNRQIQHEVDLEFSENLGENSVSTCTGTHGLRMSLPEQRTSSKNKSGDEEVCICNNMKCWSCLLVKVMESGTMQDFVNMKWEICRRKLLLRLLIRIAKCMLDHSEVHEIHEVFWQSISVLVNRKPLYDTNSAVPHLILLDYIGKERRGDIFSIERAVILYNLSLFSMKSIWSNSSRVACCDFSHIELSSVVTWLQQAFVLCRELPLLFQKVSRLLACVFLLSTLGEPFSLGLYCGKTLSVSHWAAFFHQASLGCGTYLNHQFFPTRNGQIKVCNSMDFEGSNITASTCIGAETFNLLRLAPDEVQDLQSFVTDFFKSLPTFTIICISLLGPDYATLLKDVLPCPSSFQAWVLLSRLNSNREPVVMLLPSDLILGGLDDGSSSPMSLFEGNISSEGWTCPWGRTVLDDVVPQFKQIIKENFLSSSLTIQVDTKETTDLWWTWRKNLNDRLGTFLSCMEVSWLGPWKCLVLGEPLNCSTLDSVVPKLVSDLKSKYKCDANDNLLRSILGGSGSVSQIETCISQLLLHKGCITRWGCFRETKDGIPVTACDETDILSRMPHQLITEAARELEAECISREPIVLVLDSDVQMLPWESLPELRKQEVYRMPSVSSISALLNVNNQFQAKAGEIGTIFPSIDPFDAFYLLNPSGDFRVTQLEFEPLFRDQRLEGKSGTPAKAEDLFLALKNHDLFMYFGHGSGTQYIPKKLIQKVEHCAAAFLMGCRSGSLSHWSPYNAEGPVLAYLLAGSPAIIANLWDVTDKDIDRFSKVIVNAWWQDSSESSTGCKSCNPLVEEFETMNIRTGKGKTKREQLEGRKEQLEGRKATEDRNNDCRCRPKIGSFISEAREACKLQFLTGAAPVCYGIPTSITRKVCKN